MCEDCPTKVHQPETVEGFALWDLVQRLGRQLRVGGMGRPYGFDMGVAFQMGAALDVPALLIAEILPDIEAAVIAALIKQMDSADE